MPRTRTEELSEDKKRSLLNKTRQLAVWEILSRETDDEHPMSKTHLLLRLREKGLKVTDDTVHSDIEAINLLHEKAITEITGPDNSRYYVFSKHLFTPMELRLILDGLKANPNLPAADRDDLTCRLLTTVSRSQAEKLGLPEGEEADDEGRAVSFLKKLEVMQYACEQGMQLEIQYFYVNEYHRHVLQRDGAWYLLEPQALVFQNNRYYLVAWDCERGHWAHFRVDRMDAVRCLDKKNTAREPFTRENLGEYVRRSISMYRGEECDLRLRLTDLRAIGIVFEKFGDDIAIWCTQENVWVANVRAQMSPKLWGWLCSESGLITLTGSGEAVAAYREWLQQSLRTIEDQ